MNTLLQLSVKEISVICCRSHSFRRLQLHVNNCFTALALASLSAVGSVTMSSGQSSVLDSHSGPFHHKFAFSTWPPLLARSAGLNAEGTCRHTTPWCWLILLIRFETNCLYSPLPVIQCRRHVLKGETSKRNDRNETAETTETKRNDRNETTETKRPKRNDRNETAENIDYRKNGKH